MVERELKGVDGSFVRLFVRINKILRIARLISIEDYDRKTISKVIFKERIPLTELPTKGVMEAQHILTAKSLGWADHNFGLCLCEHADFRAFFVIPDTHSLTGLYLGHTILSTFPLKYSTSCTGYVLWLLLQ